MCRWHIPNLPDLPIDDARHEYAIFFDVATLELHREVNVL